MSEQVKCIDAFLLKTSALRCDTFPGHIAQAGVESKQYGGGRSHCCMPPSTSPSRYGTPSLYMCTRLRPSPRRGQGDAHYPVHTTHTPFQLVPAAAGVADQASERAARLRLRWLATMEAVLMRCDWRRCQRWTSSRASRPRANKARSDRSSRAVTSRASSLRLP